MAPCLSVTQQQELTDRLQTDEGMSNLLNGLVGEGRWTYLPALDVWVSPGDSDGVSRVLRVWRRGGSWIEVVLPL